jgi:hypothetical protein
MNCRFLLGILFGLMILFPMLQEMARPILLIAVIASVFVLGVVIVEPGTRFVRIAFLVTAVQLLLTGAAVALTESSTEYLVVVACSFATTALLIIFSIYCVLRYVLKSQTITTDQIYAGISVYLMLGFAFGSVYYLVNILNPGGFALNTAKLTENGSPDMMYFSFVTLATLGYGDITPVSKTARALAEFEALAGMLYIAIFMARLVSLRSEDGRTISR